MTAKPEQRTRHARRRTTPPGLARLFLAGLIAGAALGGLWAWFERGPYHVADIGWYALLPALAAGLAFAVAGLLLWRPRD